MKVGSVDATHQTSFPTLLQPPAMYLPQWFVTALAVFRTAYQANDLSSAIEVAGHAHNLQHSVWSFSARRSNGAFIGYLDYESAKEGALITMYVRSVDTLLMPGPKSRRTRSSGPGWSEIWTSSTS